MFEFFLSFDGLSGSSFKEDIEPCRLTAVAESENANNGNHHMLDGEDCDE